MKSLVTVLVLGLACSGCFSLDNGLALTPPMGWLSWERFLCNTDCPSDPKNCISEQLFKDMADRMVQDGYKDLGYEYVAMDDCWMSKTRDSSGRLQPDPERFPNGIKALADYMHERGLKLGIYQNCANKTCAGFPGSLGFFDLDAQTFADWGVDMLKLDSCHCDPRKMGQIFSGMTEALNKTGRPMVFSCTWPHNQRKFNVTTNFTEVAEYCNMWRYFADIEDSWDSVESIMDYYVTLQETLVPVSGPGKWSDPDMLVIGDFGLSTDQAQTQMAIWAILAAPLLMSNDLRDMKPEFQTIIQNKQIIAINQDPLGRMGERIKKIKGIEVYRRPVTPVVNEHNSFALAFVNRKEEGGPVLLNTVIGSLGLDNPEGYVVVDLYTDKFFGKLLPTDNLQVRVNPTGVVMVKAEVEAGGNPTSTAVLE